MTDDLPDGVPSAVTAGDRWQWRDAAATAGWPPADGWVLTYRFWRDGAELLVEALVIDGAYVVDLPPVQTAQVAAGEWAWAAWVSRADDRRTVDDGRITVRPNPAAATGDVRTHAERVLEAIRAVIEGRATKDQESYSIGGRSLSRTPLDDLMRLETRYARRVAAERAMRTGDGPDGGCGWRPVRMILR